MYVTASVCSGCSIQINATAVARPVAAQAEPVAQHRQQQRATNDPEERQRSQQMDEQVPGVVPAHVEFPDGVIDREGQVRQRPARHCDLAQRYQDFFLAQAADLLVLLDSLDIV